MKSTFRKVRGGEFRIIQALMLFNIWMQGFRLYRNIAKTNQAVKRLLVQAKKVSAGADVKKGYKINGKYGWNMFHPLWPSKSFNRFFYHHLEEVMPSGNQTGTLRRLLVAITKKCPLQCEHCSEGETLNQKDILSKEEYREKIQSLLSYGVSQIVYSGGEPLNRFNDLCEIIGTFKEDCSQWIYTSGYGLTLKKAMQLKKAGLEGAAISLDHYDPSAHNDFRRNKKSFDWVEKAVKNCQAAGIVVSINVCTTKDFIRENAMPPFMDLMKRWGVSMVNVLEPRAVGHYSNQDVELNEAEKDYLAETYYAYNCFKAYRDYPSIAYPGLSRKQVSCGGGKSYLLLDYDGTLRPCPFCKTPMKLSEKPKELCEA